MKESDGFTRSPPYSSACKDGDFGGDEEIRKRRGFFHQSYENRNEQYTYNFDFTLNFYLLMVGKKILLLISS